MISIPNFQALVYASPTAAAHIGQTVLFSQLYAMPKCSAVLSTSPVVGDMVREIMDEAKRRVEGRRMPWGDGGQAEAA